MSQPTTTSFKIILKTQVHPLPGVHLYLRCCAAADGLGAEVCLSSHWASATPTSRLPRPLPRLPRSPFSLGWE